MNWKKDLWTYRVFLRNNTSTFPFTDKSHVCSQFRNLVYVIVSELKSALTDRRLNFSAPQCRSWNTTHKDLWLRSRITWTLIQRHPEWGLCLLTRTIGLRMQGCSATFVARALLTNVVWIGMRKPAARLWWFRVICVTRLSRELITWGFTSSPSMA